MLALVASAAATAAAQSLPDLITTRIAFCRADGECAEHLSSTAQTFVSVYVKNVGTRDTIDADGAIAVALVINGERHAVRSVGARLLVQEERHVTFSVPQFSLAGEYRVDAVADPGQHIAELNDANDSLTHIGTVIDRSTQGAAAGWSIQSTPVAEPAVFESPVAAAVDAAPASVPEPVPAETTTVTQSFVAAAQPEPAAGAMVPETGLPNTSEPDWVEPEPVVAPGDPIPAGRLSGIITAADNNTALSGVGVSIYDGFGQLADWRATAVDGSYVTRDLPPGDYQVVVHRNAGWQDTIYRDIPIAKYGRIVLRHGESHRFSTGSTLDAAGGDFYFGFFNDRAQFWANHDGQRGMIALGDIRSTPLEIVVPPSAGCAEPNPWLARISTPCYTRGGLDAVANHTYVALSREADPGSFIIFRVLDVQPGMWVQLSYVVSAGMARGHSVSVANGGMTTAVDQPVARVPSIVSIAPNHGPATGGTEVTITGENFKPGAAVSFGGVFASNVRVVSPTSMIAVAPAGNGGRVDIELWDPDGVMTSADVAYRFDVPGPAAFAKHVLPDVQITHPVVHLAWEASVDGSEYQVCIDTTNDQRCTPGTSATFGWASVGAFTSRAWWRHAFAPGVTYYWQVRAVNAGGFAEADAGAWSSFSVADVAIAELISPQPGSTLAASLMRFEWTAGAGVQEYRLEIGSVPGGVDLFAESTSARSATVSLPYDGRALFVRMGSLINGDWLFRDYVYTASRTLIPKLGLGEGGPNGGPRVR